MFILKNFNPWLLPKTTLLYPSSHCLGRPPVHRPRHLDVQKRAATTRSAMVPMSSAPACACISQDYQGRSGRCNPPQAEARTRWRRRRALTVLTHGDGRHCPVLLLAMPRRVRRHHRSAKRRLRSCNGADLRFLDSCRRGWRPRRSPSSRRRNPRPLARARQS